MGKEIVYSTRKLVVLKGAVATPEFLPYMDYFIRKEYGDDYYLHPDEVVDESIHQRTIDKVITDGFEQVVYCLNEPAGARNFQSIDNYFQYPYTVMCIE